MSSPTLEYIYQYTGIDPAYFIFALAFLVLVLIVQSIIILCKLKKMYRKYDRFMRGKDAESMEDTVVSCIEKAQELDKMNQILREDVISIRKNQRITFQKMGMVKYDAFREMSGSLSFALALLDQQDNGFVLNSVYAREGGYSYIKEVRNGECASDLAEEEKQALEKAKNRA